MLANTLRAGSFLTACLFAMPTALTQSALAQSVDTPQTRLRPIGAPSIVDQYRSPSRANVRETSARDDQYQLATNAGAQQAVFMQNGLAPAFPGGAGIPLPDNFSPPPISTTPLTAPPISAPPMAPRSLPVNPGQPAPSTGTFAPAPGIPMRNQDYAPLAQPSLANQFATMDNSCHVSGPSSYTAASASGCAPVGYQVPPASIAPPPPVATGPIAPAPFTPAPAVIPGAPIVAAPTGIPAGSLISFGQERNPVQVGPGLFGQPVAYVPGQKFRNWIRYMFP